MVAPQPTPPTRKSGFTLMEVLIAITIMSMIMVALYGILYASLDTRDRLEYDARASRLGPMILDIIEQDLRQAWVRDIEGDQVFKGEDKMLAGESADSLAFLTCTDSTVTRNVGGYEVSSDLCETGYRLKLNPRLQDVMELWRRQDYHIDEAPLEGGSYELLHDRVIAFQVKYLEQIDASNTLLDEWDASKRHSLPAAVLIDLAIEIGVRQTADESPAHRTGHVRNYRRFIPLQITGTDHANSALAMRIHPVIPAFIGTNDGTGGGGAGNNDNDIGASGAAGTTGGVGSPGSGTNPPSGGGGDGGGGGGGGGGGDDFNWGDFFDDLFG